MRPITTLFLLQSIDGKISTGPTNDFDFDKDLPNIPGYVKRGLHQYYELEEKTDNWSLCTGKTQAKVIDQIKEMPEKLDVNFVIYDNSKLNDFHIKWLLQRAKKLIIVTTNKHHIAYNYSSIDVIDFTTHKEVFEKLYDMGCERITIQSGGTLNKAFLDADLIDNISIVIAPITVGGKNTPSLISGDDNVSLDTIRPFSLLKVHPLDDYYLNLVYTRSR